MSAVAIQRKIDRLKSEIDQAKPKPLVRYKLIGVPPDSATDEVKAAYQKELDAAQAAGVLVIQLIGVTKEPCDDHPNTSPTDRTHPDNARRDEAKRAGEYQVPDGTRPRRWQR